MTRWLYLDAVWRQEMIAAAKEATRASGFTVYDHHPLCSSFMQPPEGCWQCRLISDALTDERPGQERQE